MSSKSTHSADVSIRSYNGEPQPQPQTPTPTDAAAAAVLLLPFRQSPPPPETIEPLSIPPISPLHQPPVQPPNRHPELTMRERLVLRERQRRIETERARLKRQFALNNQEQEQHSSRNNSNGRNTHSISNGSMNGSVATCTEEEEEEGDHHHRPFQQQQQPSLQLPLQGPQEPQGTVTQQDRPDVGINNGIDSRISDVEEDDCGTLGDESTRVHCPADAAGARDQPPLGFNMERFLRNSDVFDPHQHLQQEQQPSPPKPQHTSAFSSAEEPKRPIILDRFLNEPVLLEDVSDPNVVEDEDRTATPLIATESMELFQGDEDRIRGFDNTEYPGDLSFLEAIHNDTYEIDSTSLQNASSLNVEGGDDVEDKEEEIEGRGSILLLEPHDEQLLLHPAASMEVIPDSVASVGESFVVDAADTEEYEDLDLNLTSTNEQPRMMRLTEADMQEMAAIEEASIGNAPPSERQEEELSDIGDLVGEFRGSGGHLLYSSTNFSQGQHSHGTPTTVVGSSNSILTSTGYQSGAPHVSSFMEAEDYLRESSQSLPEIPSLSAFPPTASVDSSFGEQHRPHFTHLYSEDPHSSQQQPLVEESVARMPTVLSSNDFDIEDNESLSLVNRVLRPGMVNHHVQSRLVMGGNDAHHEHIIVDDFDFDKDAPESPMPCSTRDDSYRDLPIDAWSPPGKMQISPIASFQSANPIPPVPSIEAPSLVVLHHFSEFNKDDDDDDDINNDVKPQAILFEHAVDPVEYLESLEENMPRKIVVESASSVQQRLSRNSFMQQSSLAKDIVIDNNNNDETTSLLCDIPTEVFTPVDSSPGQQLGRRRRRSSLWNRHRSIADVTVRSLFSDVRSEEDESREEIQGESEIYLNSSILARAFPERLYALTVTLIFELPVLLMISGGSDELCSLIGRTRYQLLMGFLPLTSAISGNVGLQASTLTTRAISHTHVTPSNYLSWLRHEIGAACCLGLGMGFLLGSIAFYASGMDVPFGLTIFIAQLFSIVTAGCTGTFAPLLFSFIFHRDSGKWGGPLETAIQDIVGSFAMVVISYHILKALGPGPINPSDVCYVTST